MRKGVFMIKIYLPYIFELAENLDPLARISHENPTKMRDIYVDLLVARGAVTDFIQTSVFANSLRSSRNLAEALLTNLSSVLSDLTDIDRLIEPIMLHKIKSSYDRYKIALQAELGVTPTYFVTNKGSHDTLYLLENAEAMFPFELKSKVPESLFDVREAGKAIAFNLPTAAGYHIFRATESVLRRYYKAVSSNSPAPKVRTLGVYVNAIKRKQVGDEKVLSALEQMTNLHRNPIIHPEVALSLDDALSILGISRSVITAMLSALQAEPRTAKTAS